ncbi:GNAT family N-acetyltransferase [Kitasatospora sp. NPDC057500]|uniref:GNAT family N-acetyltransferase n=1 Tax=Kitasatospora sp. NPDC057500 TaxID=3346151 RepID=UPI00367CEB3D
MKRLDDPEELRACCRGDALCVWAAQGLDGRSRAWASDDRRAVVVAGVNLLARERAVVWGAPDAAVPLLRQVVAEVGPAYRALGGRTLIEAVVREVPGLTAIGGFGWMDRCDAPGDGSPGDAAPVGGEAVWLPAGAGEEVGRFVDMSFPDSYAKPGVPGVERWAGVRDSAGRLAAVGAHAWCAPTVGFLSGVAVHPGARRRGLGRQVGGFLIAEALSTHGTVALMVDDWNQAAIRLYEGMGLRYRPLGAVAVKG